MILTCDKPHAGHLMAACTAASRLPFVALTQMHVHIRACGYLPSAFPHWLLTCDISHGRRTSRVRIEPCHIPSRQLRNSRPTAPPTSRSSADPSRPPRTPATSSGRRRMLSRPAQPRTAAASAPPAPRLCCCQHQDRGQLRRLQVLLRAARGQRRRLRGTAAMQPPLLVTRQPRRPCAGSSAAPVRCRLRSTSSSGAPRSTQKTASVSFARCAMASPSRRVALVRFVRISGKWQRSTCAGVAV